MRSLSTPWTCTMLCTRSAASSRRTREYTASSCRVATLLYSPSRMENLRFLLRSRLTGQYSDPAEHSRRRRLMGQLFNRSQMHKLEGLMMHHIGAFMRALSSTSDEVNLMPACRALEADIICTHTLYSLMTKLQTHILMRKSADFSFGHTIGAVEAYSQGQELPMVARNDEKATWMPLVCSPNLFSLSSSIWRVSVLTYIHVVDELPKYMRNMGAPRKPRIPGLRLPHTL